MNETASPIAIKQHLSRFFEGWQDLHPNIQDYLTQTAEDVFSELVPERTTLQVMRRLFVKSDEDVRLWVTCMKGISGDLKDELTLEGLEHVLKRTRRIHQTMCRVNYYTAIDIESLLHHTYTSHPDSERDARRQKVFEQLAKRQPQWFSNYQSTLENPYESSTIGEANFYHTLGSSLLFCVLSSQDHPQVALNTLSFLTQQGHGHTEQDARVFLLESVVNFIPKGMREAFCDRHPEEMLRAIENEHPDHIPDQWLAVEGFLRAQQERQARELKTDLETHLGVQSPPLSIYGRKL